MTKTIEVKDIGDNAAERDEYLSLCFVEELPAFKHALNLEDKRYILLGRTGSGKSGIIQQVIHECNIKKGFTHSFINDSKTDFNFIVEQVKNEISGITPEIESMVYKLSWHYTIILNLLRNKYPEKPLQTFKLHTDIDQVVYNFLKQIDSPNVMSSTISDLFISLARKIKNLKFSAGFAGANISAETQSNSIANVSSYSSLLRQTEKFISQQLRGVIGGDKVYVLIDDLDLHWDPKSEIQQKLIAALFSAINIYLHEPSIKPIIALRTDIFKGLKVHQREKFSDPIIKLEWNNELLQDFIKKRILIAYDFGDDEKILTDFFEGEVEGKNLIEYMIGFTLNRPRDLLSLCKEAIQEAANDKSDRVRLKHIDIALNNYSVDRVIALHDEWKSLYPNLEALMKLLALFSTSEQINCGYAPRDFHRLANQIRDHLISPSEDQDEQPLWFLEKYGLSDENPNDLVETLYELGIIYLRDSHSIYQQASDESMPKIRSTTKIFIHPMFSRFMEKMILDEENPWLPS